MFRGQKRGKTAQNGSKKGVKKRPKSDQKGSFWTPLKSRFWLLHRVIHEWFGEGGPEGVSKIPLILGIHHVLGLESGFERQKITKSAKNHKNGQNDHFWGCRGKCQNRCFFSSRKPKWVCVIWGVPLVRGVSEGGPLLDPLLGHFWGSKMTPFNPQIALFTLVIWNRVVSEGCPKWPQKSLFFKHVKKCQNDHFLDPSEGVRKWPKWGHFWPPKWPLFGTPFGPFYRVFAP